MSNDEIPTKKQDLKSLAALALNDKAVSRADNLTRPQAPKISLHHAIPDVPVIMHEYDLVTDDPKVHSKPVTWSMVGTPRFLESVSTDSFTHGSELSLPFEKVKAGDASAVRSGLKILAGVTNQLLEVPVVGFNLSISAEDLAKGAAAVHKANPTLYNTIAQNGSIEVNELAAAVSRLNLTPDIIAKTDGRAVPVQSLQHRR